MESALMPRYPVVAPRPGVSMSPARRPYLRRDLLHEDELLFLFDESKSIPSRTYDAVEGAFFNIGTRGRRECAACHELSELVALDRCERCWSDPTTNDNGPALMTPSR